MQNQGNRVDIPVVVAFFLLALLLEVTEGFSLVENETLSYRQILRTHLADPYYSEPSEDVFVVYTDEAFYEDYDKYPLRRTDLSTIIVRLKEMGAKVIGVDVLLDFNSAYGEDPTLADALEVADNVLLVSQALIEDEEVVGMNTAIERFRELSRYGYTNVTSNSAVSETINRLRIYPEIVELFETWPFAVEAVAMYLDVDPELVDGQLRFGDEIAVQLDQFSEMYIDYPLRPSLGDRTARIHEVIGISASDILFAVDEEELEDLAYLVRDKIVLIGETAEVAHDEFETPIGNVYGVNIIASAIGTILRGGPLTPASFWLEALVMFVMMMVLLVTRAMQEPFKRNAICVGSLLATLTFIVVAYIYTGLVISLSYVLIASLLALIYINARFYIVEMGQKAQIRHMFGQYLSPGVVSDLVKNPDRLALGGEEREMTAYFSDIEKFSTFSERMTPTELVNVLNEYLTAMCNIIVDLGGTVDKFEGDSIMAFWGAPTMQPDHASLACFAAIDMNKALTELRRKWARDGRPEINVRMGLNTGPMVVGNMGSAQRMNYTIMGDAVNLASRLEGANKAYGSRMMISESTYKACEPDIDVRELDLIRVVGKEQAIRVFELLERKNQASVEMASLAGVFAEGLEAYRARDFATAEAQFQQCLKILPGDGPSTTYIARCHAYRDNPPTPDWDGVFTLETK